METKIISTEELLGFLEQAAPSGKKIKRRKPRLRVDNPTIMAFIRKYTIQPGEKRIPSYKIYHEYFVVWSGRRKIEKLGRSAFFRVFSKYFKQVRTGRQRYYLLNDCFDMMDKKLLELAFKHRKQLKRG